MDTNVPLFYQGVYIGLLLGFIVGLWIGIGAKLYPPPAAKAPFSTEKCEIMPTNSTIMMNSTRLVQAQGGDWNRVWAWFDHLRDKTARR